MTNKIDPGKIWTMFEPWPEESTSRRLENDCDCDECGPATARKRRRHGEAPAAAPQLAVSVQPHPPASPKPTSPPHSRAEPSSATEVLASSCREPPAVQGAAQDGSGRLAARGGSHLATAPSIDDHSRSEVLSESARSTTDRPIKQQSLRAATGMSTAERKKEDEAAAVLEEAAGYPDRVERKYITNLDDM